MLISSNSSIKIPVHPDHVRVLVDPFEPKLRSRAIACIAAEEIYKSGIGDWLEANVRDQKMSSGIARSITKTLDERPETMHPLNRGLTVLAHGFRYDSQEKVLWIDFRDRKHHGIIDGGHTFRAIEQVINKRLKAEMEPPRAFVNVEVLAGYDDVGPDIIRTRNLVCEVRDSAIYSLEGVFEDLRKHLVAAGIDSLVAFKQNEAKPISIEEVIALTYLFHPKFADGTAHPMKAYSSGSSCAEIYAEEWKLKEGKTGKKDQPKDSKPWDEGFGKIVHLVPEILRLAEEIEIEIDETYCSSGGAKGLLSDDFETEKEGRGKGRKLKEFSGPRELQVTGKSVPHGWPTGYLYPIIGALRPVVDYSGSLAIWKTANPLQILESVKKQLVKKLFQFADQFGRKPNAVGKNELCWSSLYETVENACLRELAKK